MASSIADLVDVYIDELSGTGIDKQVDSEKYKFDSYKKFNENFDLQAEDLAVMLERAIPDNNLTGGGVYFPRRMLLKFAKQDPDAVRAALTSLADESLTNIERIGRFHSAMIHQLHKYNQDNDSELTGADDARFISLLLSMMSPNQFINYKYSQLQPVMYKYYSKDAKLKGSHVERIELASKFGKDVLREFQQRPEFRGLKDSLAPGVDDDNLWLAQDIYWTVAGILESNLSVEHSASNEDSSVEPPDHNHSLNTILYGPPGTGKTYSVKKYKNQILGEQKSVSEGLLKGRTRETILNIFSKDNTPRTAPEIWRSPSFQAHQKYNGRKVSNAAAVQNDLQNNLTLFERIEEGSSVKYRATPEGIDIISSILEEERNEPREDKDDFYEFITFHQSYGYEDFIEGIRAETSEQGGIKYEVKDGVFKTFCRRAERDPDNNYLFVIDEINRANISKVFGELITLLEADKRLGAGEDQLTAVLPYSREKFGIPKNVYLLGTMNTADRSIALLDIALRRRFDFVEIMPKPEKISNDFYGIDLQKLLKSLNARILEVIDRNHQIGHAYFMNLNTLGDLERAWYNRIVPLLQEYSFDNSNDLRSIIKMFITNGEVATLEGEDFKQALISLYDKETQNTD